MNRLQRRLRRLLPLTLVALGGPVFAQGPVTAQRVFFTPWPEEGNEVEYERAVSGRFGADALLDVGVLRTLDGVREAGYVSNVDRYNHFAVVRSNANDVAVLPGAASDGRDGLLVAVPQGVELYVVGASGNFELDLALTDAAWLGTQRVWTVADAAGDTWLFGLDALGTSLLRAVWSSTTRSFVAQTPVVLPPGLSHLETLNYDGPSGQGSLELALWFGTGVFVTDWAGTPLIYVDAAPNPGDLPTPAGARLGVTISHGDDASPDPFQRDLVCIYGYWSPGGDFVVWSFNDEALGWTTVASLQSGNGATLGLVAADYDADGFGDLLLPHVDGSRVTLLRRDNQDPDPFERSVALGDRFDLIQGTELPPDAVDLLLPCEMDEDEDTDFLAFQNDSAGVQSFLSAADGMQAAPGESFADPFTLSTPENGNWKVDLSVDLPQGWASLDPRPTHVHVEGWFQPDATQLLISARRIHVYLELPTDPQATFVADTLDWDPDGLDPYEFVLQLHVTLVEGDGVSTTHRYPSRTHYFIPSLVTELDFEDDVHFENTGTRPSGGAGVGGGEGGTGNAGGGDGNVSGNRGAGGNPSPPPSPNGS